MNPEKIDVATCAFCISMSLSWMCTLSNVPDCRVRPEGVGRQREWFHARYEESFMFTKLCKWVSVLGAMTFAIAVPGCEQVSSVLSTVLSTVTGGN